MKILPTISLPARKTKGSSIAEFAPMLFVLLLIVLFPMIDFIAMGLGYCCANTLNAIQLREACVTRATAARDTGGPIKRTLVDNWRNTGIGAFTKPVAGSIVTRVNYYQGTSANDIICEVDTSMSIDPFLQMPIPFLGGLPGLNAPCPYRFVSQQLLEDPNNFDLMNTTQNPPVRATLPSTE